MACVNNAEGLGVKLKGFRADHVLSSIGRLWHYVFDDSDRIKLLNSHKSASLEQLQSAQSQGVHVACN